MPEHGLLSESVLFMKRILLLSSAILALSGVAWGADKWGDCEALGEAWFSNFEVSWRLEQAIDIEEHGVQATLHDLGYLAATNRFRYFGGFHVTDEGTRGVAEGLGLDREDVWLEVFMDALGSTLEGMTDFKSLMCIFYVD